MSSSLSVFQALRPQSVTVETDTFSPPKGANLTYRCIVDLNVYNNEKNCFGSVRVKTELLCTEIFLILNQDNTALLFTQNSGSAERKQVMMQSFDFNAKWRITDAIKEYKNLAGYFKTNFHIVDVLEVYKKLASSENVAKVFLQAGVSLDCSGLALSQSIFNRVYIYNS